MNIINKLPLHLTNLIAAGEVVERPASVIKELVENSVDAGAGALTVEIKRGGMSFIRVTDNGKGMSPQDAVMAFERHATSKLRDEYGLEAIGTLGFRGEALAAIAAVSRVRLFTRETGAEEGTALVLEGGELISQDQAGCPDGTTITIQDLFFNTPARLKFMKKDQAEAAAVTAAVIRCALSRPEIALSYIKDGEEQFYSPGDGKALSAIYAVLGRDFAKDLLPVEGSGDGMEISGYVSTPAAAKGSRSNQFFFVNGRSIRSQLLQAAVEQAYKNSLFTGRFPGCVLYITMKLNALDVNIHPAKTEVKFFQERAVFDAVYRSVLKALSGESSPPEISLSGKSPAADNTAPSQSGTKPGLSAYADKRPAAGPETRRSAPGASYTGRQYDDTPPAQMRQVVEQLVFRTQPVRYETASDEKTPPHVSLPPEENGKAAAAEKTGYAQPLVTEAESRETEYRIIGEAFNEVLIVQSGDELILIDKHAAHERMLFDRLMQERPEGGKMTQQLLTPITVRLSPEHAQLLLENAELMLQAGFEADDFGSDTLLIHALPADVDAADAEALLSQMAEAIKTGRRPNGIGPQAEVMATVACKAAIKAGKGSDPLEWKPVVEAVLSGSVKYCPHGRPVAMRITKRQIDKNFKRTE